MSALIICTGERSIRSEGYETVKVLVTGGAGYIGSHTCKALAAAGHEPVTLDNLSTGHRELVKYGPFIHGDIRDVLSVRQALAQAKPKAVIHFAASAYVGVSIREPRFYYRNNVVGTLNLLDAMRESGVDKFVFSSSCATYGEPAEVPIKESEKQVPINPYGKTKLICEEMSRDIAAADSRFECIALRYFNASGADRDGKLGEMHDPETHLIPLILRNILEPTSEFVIFGHDYDTPDGTCIRDYLHVEDLATAHVKAIERLSPGFHAYNLGTGRGNSVLEIVKAAERITGRKVTTSVGSRRPGDPSILVADPSLAHEKLNWIAEVSDIETIIRSAWLFERAKYRHSSGSHSAPH